jgi:hypothetical protein
LLQGEVHRGEELAVVGQHQVGQLALAVADLAARLSSRSRRVARVAVDTAADSSSTGSRPLASTM